MAPYLKAYIESQMSKAQTMLDGIDAAKNLRNGTIRSTLDGQEVYYEPYSLSAIIMAKRPDGSEPQSLYSEGEERRTGKEYTVKEGIGDQPFVIKTEKANEGIWWGVEASYKYESSDTRTETTGATADATAAGATTTAAGATTTSKERQEIALGAISAWYSPLKVHVKALTESAPVYEGGTGTATLFLTDIQDRYCLDGYTLSAESADPGIFTVESPTVTTGMDGKATIRLHGVKEGKAELTVKIHLSEADSGSYVDAEKTVEIEVKPAEEWTYSFQIHDAYMEPADDYTLSGSFKVIRTVEADSLVHTKMVDLSEAVKSNAGSYPVDGGFMDETNTGKGIALAFNMKQLETDAKEAKKQAKKLEKELRKDIMRYIRSMLFGGVETFTYQSSTDPICCAIIPFVEGTHTFELTADKIAELSGIEMPENESDPMPQMTEAEMQRKMFENMQAELDGNHCIVLPEVKKMLFLKLGNILLIEMKAAMMGEVSEATLQKELFCLRGSLTLTKVK